MVGKILTYSEREREKRGATRVKDSRTPGWVALIS